jgi:hypothetical protein
MSRKADGAKKADINLSNFVRFLYDFSPNPGEGDTPEIKKAIQAAHYVKREAEKVLRETALLDENEKLGTGDSAETAKSASQKKATKAKGPTLAEALRVVLASVEEQEEVRQALWKFKWQEKVKETVETVLSLYSVGAETKAAA